MTETLSLPKEEPSIKIAVPAVVWVVEGRSKQYLRGVGNNIPLFSPNRTHALIIKDESVAVKVAAILEQKGYTEKTTHTEAP